MTVARMLLARRRHQSVRGPSCQHRPGTVVEVDPAEEVFSTCVRCGTPIVQRYENIGDEDRVAGWGRWRPVYVALD